MRAPPPRSWPLASVLASLVACGSPGAPESRDDAHEQGHDEEHEGGHDEGHAHAQTTAWVEVSRPRDSSLIELPARVVASPDSRAHIETPLRAVVESIHVRAGDRVAVGDPIAELRIPAVLEAAAVLAGTSKQIGSHEARRERLEELRAAGLVGASEVFDVESGIGRLSAERRLALATLAAVGVDADERRAVLARGTVVFRAPIEGVVAELQATPGEVIEAGEGLALLLGRGPARIEVSSAGELPAVLAELDVTLEFEGFDGSHVVLEPKPLTTAVEPGLGRVLAWYATADPELQLADGLRGRVQLRGTGDDLLEVPRRALRLDQGRAWVGRRPTGEGPAEMIEVEVLRSAGSSALIRSEALALGDEVAADAATVLMLGRDPGELGGGHQH